MSKRRAQRLSGSLGASWDDAEYSPEDDPSLYSASDMTSDSGVESELEHTALGNKEPNKIKYGSANRVPFTSAQRTTRTSATSVLRTPRPRRAARLSPANVPVSPSLAPQYQALQEPAFIMPSNFDSSQSFDNLSPTHQPEMRTRKVRVPRSEHVDSGSVPRKASRRVPKQSSSERPSQSNLNHGRDNHLPGQVLWTMLTYLMNLLGMTMRYLQPFFAVGLAVVLLALVLGQAGVYVKNGVQTALSPFCAVPFSSRVLPFCAEWELAAQSGTIEPDFAELMDIQSNFEDIIKENRLSAVLPYTMKSSEAAIRDLRTVVRYSRLPSKSQLEVEFDSFIDTAGQATRDLITYNQKIGLAVDMIIYSNQFTMQVLHGISEKYGNTGFLESVVNKVGVLGGFQPPPKIPHEKVFDLYLSHVTANRERIQDLIRRSTSLLTLIGFMEQQLEAMHELAVQDKVSVSQNRDELLSQLWTKLGGNSATRKDHERQLELLNHVSQYRHELYKNVNSILIKLQVTDSALGDLRDTIAEPEKLGYRSDIPIQHYLELVEQSTNRLQDARGEARRFEMRAYEANMGRDKGDPSRELPSGRGPRGVSATAVGDF